MTFERVPKGLLIDDDLDFITITKVSFKKAGIELDATQKYEVFLEKIKTNPPDFCMIDLNFNGVMAGFSLVAAIRSKVNSKIPLFIVSANADSKAVTHAMEIGATEYIFKPVDIKLFCSKLEKYINTQEIKKQEIACFKVPKKGAPGALSMGMEMVSMDENGITLRGPFMITKGVILQVDHPLFKKVTEAGGHLMVRVVSSWVEEDEKSFGVYAEYTTLPEDQLAAIRFWLLSQVNKKV